ncbi:MAG: diguanylate cyclase [Thiogranum sp.]|nr:diguanylate cyclase [Thiogranum sp.]
MLDDLPQLPAAVIQLLDALSDDATDRHRLARILDQCPSLSAKLVGLANSAYFRRRSPVNSVSDAIFVIGFRTVRSLAVATALQEPFANNRCPAFHPGPFWLHAVLTAHVARELAKKASPLLSLNPDEAYLCGLLHGIGLLALTHLFPDELHPMLRQGRTLPGALAEQLQQRFGATHHGVGAALLKRWHVPELFTCTTAHYANPEYQGSCWMACRLIAVAHDWADRVIHQDTTNTFDQHGLNLLGIKSADSDSVGLRCLEQCEVFKELAEQISGETAQLCDPETVADAAAELKSRLVDSIESLSSLTALTEIDVEDWSEEAVLRSALNVLMANQDMQRCSIFRVEENELLNAVGLDWSEHNAAGSEKPLASAATHRFKVGEGLIGLAAATGEIQHCRDCSADPRFQRTQTNADAGLGSIISVPIRFRDETLGVLNISHPHPNVFDEWDERFLYVFCNLLGQLIKSNRLLRNMEHKIAQRTLELEVALERAESLSVLDGLTGVHNRRYFISNFSTLIEQCARYGHTLALLMIDVDDFKKINDTYGHLEGDRILKAIASILKERARGADIIARFGGEEFIVALQETDCEGANRVADRIQQQIRMLSCGVGEQKRGITTSMGLTCYTKAASMPVKTPEQWIQEADDALYRAKRLGKNRIAVHVADLPKSGR